MKEKDIKVVNELKILSLDMINLAGSGHPGICLSAAPILYTLYANHLRIMPNEPEWMNRDRFVLSCGHASALLYSTLHMAGYNISLNDLKSFRRLNSITPGHPEYEITPGVEATTGLLGQGIAQAVGICLSERYISNLIDKEEDKKTNLINYNTYVLASDGDLMEGISYEALSFAGAQKLDKLIVLYDDNNMSIDGTLESTFNEDMTKRFESIGFSVFIVKDGNNLNMIDKAINEAKKSSKPSIVVCKTILGKGSYNENTNIVHGTPLEESDLYNLRQSMNISTQPFYVTKDSFIYMQEKINKRMEKEYNEWTKVINNLNMSKSEEMTRIFDLLKNKNNDVKFDSKKYTINETYNEELRLSNYKVMNLFANKNNFMLNASADLFSSCKNVIDNSDIMTYLTPLGKNIRFGVREHAMGGILNGMALSGLKVCGSTFLAFSDYLKPAIRMSAMMNLPVTYIFTHDSVMIGQDGPTHQPIEQLSSLRTIPNFITYRPADIIELMGCWDNLLKQNRPNCLVVAKEKMQRLPGTNQENISYGAYSIRKNNNPNAILIASGSEVKTALIIASRLMQQNIYLDVVSIPSLELFKEQSKEYKKSLLPDNMKKIVIEACNTDSIGYLATDEEHVFGINEFGYSATANEILNKLEFDIDSLITKIERMINN